MILIVCIGEPYAFYIGLTRTGNGSWNFSWEDGEQLDGATAQWDLNEPDFKEKSENYVIMGTLATSTGNFKWRDVNDVIARYICERKIGLSVQLQNMTSGNE